MNINENSWHYRIMDYHRRMVKKYSYGRKMPIPYNICEYIFIQGYILVSFIVTLLINLSTLALFIFTLPILHYIIFIIIVAAITFIIIALIIQIFDNREEFEIKCTKRGKINCVK